MPGNRLICSKLALVAAILASACSSSRISEEQRPELPPDATGGLRTALRNVDLVRIEILVPRRAIRYPDGRVSKPFHPRAIDERDSGAISDLLEHLELRGFDPEASGYYGSAPWVRLLFLRDNRPVEELSVLPEARALRWDRWKSDHDLTAESAGHLRRWLAARGVVWLEPGRAPAPE